MSDAKYVHTFKVSGGTGFTILVDGNPRLEYDGRYMELLRVLCTPLEARQLATLMRQEYGCTVDYKNPEINSEQKQEKQNVLSILGEDKPLPCSNCLECSWFDPHLDSLCGAGAAKGQGWDSEALQATVLQVKFAEDLKKCPLRPTVEIH